MKKVITLLIAVAMVVSVLALAACGEAKDEETTTTKDPETDATTPKSSETETTTSTETTKATETETTTETTTATETTTVTHPDVEIPTTFDGKLSKDSIKILAIGNSFSEDSMNHLYGILHDMGAKEIVLGNMYIGGCSLETHSMNIEFDVAAYDYQLNTSGTWTKRKADIRTAVEAYDWDYISLQQVSGKSGLPETYEPHLTDILTELKEMIKKKCPNAKIVWNMTWAYEGTSSHTDFAKYNKDQMTMYQAIVDTVKDKVLTHDEFSLVIPVGTAVQNLRTSYIGDNVTRDGYHLNLGFGRYTAALTWAKTLTGWDIDDVTWVPNGFSISNDMLTAIKDAVNKAVKTPDAVTESSYKDKPPVPTIENADAVAMLKAAGKNPDDYYLIDPDLTYYAYYNSGANSTLQTRSNSTATNLNQFAATRIFQKEDLPNGTMILLKKGYQYRPEGWVALTSKNTSSSRPANVTAGVVTVDAKWWGSWGYRAFNIAKAGNPALSDADMTALKDVFFIFVPKHTDEEKYSGKTVEEIFSIAGYDASKYKKLDLGLTYYAYYNSTAGGSITSKESGSTAANLDQFAATKKFTKDDLPDGTVIILKTGYQYRPEGWTSENAKNASSARPSNVTDCVVTVDSAWWGSWNIRAFNIAKAKNPALTSNEMSELQNAFAIYIPVK